jgi:hypothetical protein
VAGKCAVTIKSVNTPPIDPSFHHVNHRDLLEIVAVGDAPKVPVDALVVPTARPVKWLDDALSLASELGCGLLAMCSGAVKAVEVVECGERAAVPVIAVDVFDHDHDRDYNLPDLESAKLIDQTFFMRPSDTSKKRNLAMLLARMAGWERIFLLDDDIYDLQPEHVRAAVGLLGRFDVIGMQNLGYPDNSVVCHVYRWLGGKQAQFIGAGALAVAPLASHSFFPNVYNQDWFFILGLGQQAEIGVTGKMKQKDYDPFLTRDRAYHEELGDCLAEGLYWLLDHKKSLEDANLDHWRDFLSRRGYFLDELVERVLSVDGERLERRRMFRALEIARATRELIEPGFCAEYVRRWRADLETWRSFIDERPVGLGVAEALEQVKWPGVFTTALPWPSSAADGCMDEDRLRCQNGWRAPTADTEPASTPGCDRDASRHPPAPAQAGAAG